jgi:hypothetical protein
MVLKVAILFELQDSGGSMYVYLLSSSLRDYAWYRSILRCTTERPTNPTLSIRGFSAM